MYYSAPQRNYSIFYPPKPKKSKLIRRSTFPVNSAAPEFQIELSFSQKKYFPMESVYFEVKVNNPDEFNIEKVRVALIQNTTTRVMSGDTVTRHEPPIPIELNSVSMGYEDFSAQDHGHVHGHGGRNFGGGNRNDIEWRGVLGIPETNVPPSDFSGVRYFLQVTVDKSKIGEGRILKVSEDYPIRIGPHDDDEQSQSQNQIPHSLLRLDLVPPQGKSVRELDKFAPPRYSNLSLNKDSRRGSTSSYETLPPYYDDIALGEYGK